MTSAKESQHLRHTRWLATCVTALGLAAGVVTGSAVASADDGTPTNSDLGTSTGPLNTVTQTAAKANTTLTTVAKTTHDVVKNVLSNIR